MLLPTVGNINFSKSMKISKFVHRKRRVLSADVFFYDKTNYFYRNNKIMERLFKIHSVYRTSIKGKNMGDADRPKVEITLCYHETYFSSQSGPGIRQQYIQVSLLDEAANNWLLEPGNWIVASVGLNAYESRTEPGRINEVHYLDRYVVVTNWNLL